MTDDEVARRHMQRNPDYEVIVGTDDRWHCITCEQEEAALLAEAE
ncbi:hypothetical protein ACQSSU_20595 [Micromonospora echinospora]